MSEQILSFFFYIQNRYSLLKEALNNNLLINIYKNCQRLLLEYLLRKQFFLNKVKYIKYHSFFWFKISFFYYYYFRTRLTVDSQIVRDSEPLFIYFAWEMTTHVKKQSIDLKAIHIMTKIIKIIKNCVDGLICPCNACFSKVIRANMYF